jgi:hypothetical protein
LMRIWNLRWECKISKETKCKHRNGFGLRSPSQYYLIEPKYLSSRTMDHATPSSVQ